MPLLYGGDDRQRRQSVHSAHELCLEERYRLLTLGTGRKQSGNGGTASASLHQFLRRARTGVYAQTSGLQLQHEIPQRYLQGQSAFHEDMNEKRRILDMLMKQYTDNECSYAEPAVRNVKIWEVKVDEISCRSFGLRPSEIK